MDRLPTGPESASQQERTELGNFAYQECTNDIEIIARPFFMPERSDPRSGVWFYGYKITIINHGTSPMQLIDRHWIIRDGHGRQETIKGQGVVGQMPLIEQAESYHYSSFCPLSTPTGNMRGHYTFRDHQGHFYEIKIPLFFFRPPPSYAWPNVS